MSKIKICYLIIALLLIDTSVFSNVSQKNGYDFLPQYILKSGSKETFSIVENGKAAQIYVDPSDWKGVIRAAKDLGDDIKKVTTVSTSVVEESNFNPKSILIGTIGKSAIIDKLIAEKKIDVSPILNKWESFIIQTVEDNLVIVGSDKRATIFGIYDISEKIGVSPWYWWADVPVKTSKELFVKNGTYLQESPKVKYRGIFINDEWPSFGDWTHRKFGGFNSKMYTHMFELLLRLKANYLWPAMWNAAFNEDDPMNPVLADEYGIVMGTSHHEPMMRAHKEYTKRRTEIGPWDYINNKENINKFFKEGLERNKYFDNIITIGMRGDGDSPMGKGNDEENIGTLRDVIKGQRKIISEVYGRNPSEIPQLWAIFTEVQRYYDAGLTVPDDVTLLFCDNNWGQIRRTGPTKEKKRKGGLGLYYHIDMNGGPASDRWVNTTTIPKLREQLNLAYQTGIDQIWIINVGDLKPKELPIDFIMRYAWNPDAISARDVSNYTVEWAKQIFGEEHAVEIADIVSRYSKYNLMRKAEVQHPMVFSHVNYHESDRMLQLWHDVVNKAEILEHKISPEAKDAYYQLVLYPTKASAGVAEMYIAAGKNNIYARQGRVSANDFTDRAGVLFELDKKLSDYYNQCMSKGKWCNMMSDNHIGYVSWPIPKVNQLPPFEAITPLSTPTMGVAVEGSELSWPDAGLALTLPTFEVLEDNSYYIDVYNRGRGSFEFRAVANKSWIKVSQNTGCVDKEKRLNVTIDWNQLSLGNHQGEIIISSGNNQAVIKVNTKKYAIPSVESYYFGGAGEFSIPAYQYNRIIAGKNAQWKFAPDLGREEGCMLIEPVTAPSAKITDAPCLEYDIYLPEDGDLTVALGILPTQDINPARGLRMAIAVDDEKPHVVDMRKGMHNEFREYTSENIARSKFLKPLPPVNKNFALAAYGKKRRSDTFDGLRWVDETMESRKAGMHTIKIYMVDPELVLEKIVVNPDNSHYSYMGKPSKCL